MNKRATKAEKEAARLRRDRELFKYRRDTSTRLEHEHGRFQAHLRKIKAITN